MPNTAPVVLLTRPTAPAAQFRQMLGADVNVILSPVIKIVPIAFSVDLATYQTLVFASQHAVQSMRGLEGLANKHAYAVGAQTAKAARDIGLSVAESGGNADDLVAKIIGENPVGRVLFVRGVFSRGEVKERLIIAGIETESLVTYDQVEEPLSALAKQILGGDQSVVLPLFSPRSAQIMAKIVQKCPAAAPLTVIAMSAAVLAAWDSTPAAKTVAVAKPTQNAMAEEILRQVRRLA